MPVSADEEQRAVDVLAELTNPKFLTDRSAMRNVVQHGFSSVYYSFFPVGRGGRPEEWQIFSDSEGTPFVPCGIAVSVRDARLKGGFRGH